MQPQTLESLDDRDAQVEIKARDFDFNERGGPIFERGRHDFYCTGCLICWDAAIEDEAKWRGI
jgi:hypothetical protein